jgi:hypothetical protein
MITILSTKQQAEIRKAYKPGDRIQTIADKYKVSYDTIRNVLGSLYVSKGHYAPREHPGKSEKCEIKAIKKKQIADKYFDRIKVGEIRTLSIRDPDTLRTKYISITGKVIQKTDSLIIIKANRVYSISKSDILIKHAIIAS